MDLTGIALNFISSICHFRLYHPNSFCVCWFSTLNPQILSSELFSALMDWGYVHKIWDKWASNSVGSSDEPLKAAFLINYDPTGPSRLSSTIAEQEGIKADPTEMSQFLGFYKRNNFQTETFVIGSNEYLVTSIHENWFAARCLNNSKAAGEGAVVMQTSAFLLVGLYDGSVGSASRAVVAVDQLYGQLSRKNL